MEDYKYEDGSYRDEGRREEETKANKNFDWKKALTWHQSVVKGLAKEKNRWAFQPYNHP